MEVPEGAACWAFIKGRVNLFIYGFYPVDERWRVDVSFVLLALAIVPVLYDRLPGRKHWMWYVAAFPFIVAWLLVGGFGLPFVGNRPVRRVHADPRHRGHRHLVLAPDRHRPCARADLRHARPSHPVACCSYEFIRGVPLITLLFVASTMLNYFLPPGTTFDLLMRVLIMVTALFLRVHRGGSCEGGLQGRSRGGQGRGGGLARPLLLEGAAAHRPSPRPSRSRSPASSTPSSGSTRTPPWCSSSACSTPSASERASLADAEWAGLAREMYLFIAVFFFLCCFGMSRYSLYLEAKLDTSRERQVAARTMELQQAAATVGPMMGADSGGPEAGRG